MRIIISPAKKMNVDTDRLPYESLPQFLSKTEILKNRLQTMSPIELKNLWACNDSITKLNIERLQSMNLEENLTPAILSYEGIQYKYMAPSIFEYDHFDYINEHLRILSGFYGMLRPFDGVVPYRLEMQARLIVNGMDNLYDFWGNCLATQLQAETDFIINLASKEYSKVIYPHLKPNTKFLTCTFGEQKEGKIIEKGTMCKMARGEMVRYLAEGNIKKFKDIKEFNRLGYTYSIQLSTEYNYIFIKGEQKNVRS